MRWFRSFVMAVLWLLAGCTTRPVHRYETYVKVDTMYEVYSSNGDHCWNEERPKLGQGMFCLWDSGKQARLVQPTTSEDTTHGSRRNHR